MSEREPARPVTVALDALGAEHGNEAVSGALRELNDELRDRLRLLLFCDPADPPAVPATRSSAVTLVQAPELIGNDEDPVRAVRSRPNASIVRAAGAVAEGEADALVSPGSTGATLAAATFALRRIHGVKRPALAVQLPAPALKTPVLMLDAGANSDARPSHLVQFGHLGAAFASSVLGVEVPRVGLLSVGSEAKKGSELVVEAHAGLLASKEIEFVGNVEGRDLLAGAADVVVTDGFTGNVTLKTIEGTARAVGSAVSDAARSGPVSILGGLLLRRSLGGLRRSLDPDNTGGAVMLGLRKPAVVAHGSAGPAGIANAIRLAASAVREDVVARTAAALDAGGVGRAALRDNEARE